MNALWYPESDKCAIFCCKNLVRHDEWYYRIIHATFK
uniref:Uncharacterized protein n=1 Tax=Anguilla anguilla TaxID=7936 RepID=A0A0E9RWT1_ANGAN